MPGWRSTTSPDMCCGERRLGTESSDYAYGIAINGPDNVYLTGVTRGSLGGLHRGAEDVWVAKYSTRR